MTRQTVAPTPLTMPKEAADFFVQGVKAWKAALLVLAPYAQQQPAGPVRTALLTEVRILERISEHAEQTVITSVEA